MNIHKSTRQFEDWLKRYTTLVPKDITFKHEQMTLGAFPFLRATYYRWAQIWPEVCPELVKAPIVLSVGDLHVENFGTWQDAEARLVWGVNDFDEASPLPYTHDLVRLATSAQLAIEANHLCLKCVHAYDAILTGYAETMKTGGRPFVLEADHSWLREIAHSSLRDPTVFWKKLTSLPLEPMPILQTAVVALEDALPIPGMPYVIRHRVAGLGNLGKPRYVAIAERDGAHLAREAKALVPSAAVWANDTGDHAPEIFYQAIMEKSVRSQDPFVRLSGHWIVRRLAPDSSRIELSSLPEEHSETQLLHAMGCETANIHLSDRKVAAAILRDLKNRKRGWLEEAADLMTKRTNADWEAWRRG